MPYKPFLSHTLNLLLLFGLVPIVPVYAQSDGGVRDFQVWNETTLIFPLRKTADADGKSSTRVSLLLMGTLRLGQNRLFPIERRIGTGINFRLNKYFSVMPSYYFRNAEPRRGRKESEHRVRFEVNIENKWKTFSLKDRHRFEYRIRHSSDDSVRYRNRLTLKVPVKIGGKEVFAPFVSDEIFYDLKKSQLFRNEISAGISKKLSDSLEAEFFYLRQDNRTGNIPKTINAVGVNLKIELD
ncbi:hypothetical protein BH24ACI3_BH24ACI3_03710 [soil metagenome]